MILIIGNHHDDVLYFETKIRNKKEYPIIREHKLVLGTMFNQDVGIVYGGNTDYLTLALLNTVLSKEYVILVIHVGRCQAYTKDLKNGEVIIARQTILGEVDIHNQENSMLGQIPSCPQSYMSDPYILDSLVGCFNAVTTTTNYHVGTIISFEKSLEKTDILDNISSNGIVFGQNTSVACDNSTGGVGLACYLHNIPFISCKVIDGKIGEKRDIHDYVNVLKKYSDVGKTITACIGEISRNDVISGR